MAVPIFLDKAKKEKGDYIVGFKSGMIIEFEKISLRYGEWICLEGIRDVSVPDRTPDCKKYNGASLYGHGLELRAEEIAWMTEASNEPINDIKGI